MSLIEAVIRSLSFWRSLLIAGSLIARFFCLIFPIELITGRDVRHQGFRLKYHHLQYAQ